jgi:hypothetical protein
VQRLGLEDIETGSGDSPVDKGSSESIFVHDTST